MNSEREREGEREREREREREKENILEKRVPVNDAFSIRSVSHLTHLTRLSAASTRQRSFLADSSRGSHIPRVRELSEGTRICKGGERGGDIERRRARIFHGAREPTSVAF